MWGKKEVLARDQTREYLVRAGGGRSLEREEKGQGQGWEVQTRDYLLKGGRGRRLVTEDRDQSQEREDKGWGQYLERKDKGHLPETED